MIVEIAGFKKYIEDKVVLQINETRVVDIPLEVGGTQETVTVTTEGSNLNQTDANLGFTVDRKRVDESHRYTAILIP